MRPTTISKVNTLLQLVLMSATLTSTVFQQPSTEVLTALQYVYNSFFCSGVIN